MTIDSTVRREELLALREQLLADDRSLSQDLESGGELTSSAGDQHPADHATELLDHELEESLERNTARLVAEIDAALSRLDAGTYGLCAVCGTEIPAERLAAFPYATLCVPHKREAERDRA